MIDTHAHLQGLEGGAGRGDRGGAARRASERIVCIGDSPELAEEAIGLARAHPGVFATAGLHPHRADDWSDDVRGRARRAAGAIRAVVAVGECGLDYYRDRAPRDGAGARPSPARSSSPSATASRS